MLQVNPDHSAWRQAEPPIFNVPGVVLGLVAVLVLIHGLLAIAGQNWQVWALYAFAFIPARLGGGHAIPMMAGSQLWSFLTYAFLHGGWLHCSPIACCLRCLEGWWRATLGHGAFWRWRPLRRWAAPW